MKRGTMKRGTMRLKTAILALFLLATGALAPGSARAAPGGAGVADWLPQTLRIARARLTLEDTAAPALTMRGIELALDGDAPAGETAGRLAVQSMALGGDPPWLAPLWFSGRFRHDAGGWGLDGVLANAGADLRLNIAVRHRRETAAGRLELSMPPLRLAAEGPTLAAIAPRLAEWVGRARGRVALEARLGWGGAADESAEIMLEDVGLSAGPARIEALNGVVRLERLLSPRTAGRQELAIGLVDIGLPLTDGRLRFRIDEAMRLTVERITFAWAGGELAAGDIVVEPLATPPRMPRRVVLEAEGLELGAIMALAQLDGVSGEGRFDGRLPVEITEAPILRIDGGVLEARGPGVIRYRPESPPPVLRDQGQSVELLLRALDNFHYEGLRMTLDGRTDGEMRIGLKVEGANPDLYGGHPIELNLNLDGPLALLMQQGLDSYRLPEGIAERLERFRRDGAGAE